jgi:Tat protein translocase TatB subunit
MFNLGFGEILVICVVLIIVVGPERLPAVMKNVGKTLRTVRQASREIQTSVGLDELWREDVLAPLPPRPRVPPPATVSRAPETPALPPAVAETPAPPAPDSAAIAPPDSAAIAPPAAAPAPAPASNENAIASPTTPSAGLGGSKGEA